MSQAGQRYLLSRRSNLSRRFRSSYYLILPPSVSISQAQFIKTLFHQPRRTAAQQARQRPMLEILRAASTDALFYVSKMSNTPSPPLTRDSSTPETSTLPASALRASKDTRVTPVVTEEQSINSGTVSKLMRDLFDFDDEDGAEEEEDEELVRKVRKKSATGINDLIAAVPSALDVMPTRATQVFIPDVTSFDFAKTRYDISDDNMRRMKVTEESLTMAGGSVVFNNGSSRRRD